MIHEKDERPVSLFFQMMVPIIVGAAVGGLTNLLAIKMLFHPYKAIYIKKWRLPFTPGLIPKRREDLAEALGKLVVRHLISADRLQHKLDDPAFSEQATARIQAAFRRRIDNGITAGELIRRLGCSGQPADMVNSAIKHRISVLLHDFFSENDDRVLEQVLPEALLKKAEERLPDVAGLIVEEAASWMESPSGIRKVARGIDFFMEGGGLWKELLLKFIGRQNILKQVYPAVILAVRTPAFKESVQEWLDEKWRELLGRPLKTVLRRLGTDEEQVSKQAAEWLSPLLRSEKWLNVPLKYLPPNIQGQILGQLLPQAVSAGLSWMGKNAADVLKRLDLETMVTEQVQSFSLSELEQIIFSITKRELRLITNLGFLLGGLIGLFQAMFLLLFR
ncbi:DUF445 family protein [Sporolactobacillus sp. THM7-7]|nr:DUF445 family protein [Sporolactobacillus sp. THM7-7]